MTTTLKFISVFAGSCLLILTSLQLSASEQESNCTTPLALSVLDESVYNVLPRQIRGCNVTMGYRWLEGPVWSQKDGCLLFSDIPSHRVMRYCPASGTDVYLANSGYSNGLAFDHNSDLVLMQSRSRQVAKMTRRTSSTEADFDVLAYKFDGKRLNSPNDVAITSSGTLYFTDPPYGLAQQLEDPAKELPFQGVYRLTLKGILEIMDDSLVYPNGITLIEAGTAVIVAASNPSLPAWYRYDLDRDGKLVNRTTFAVANDPRFPIFKHGLPDGLKQHSSGLIFATGPGGIWVFGKDGKLKAHIQVDRPVANLAFTNDEKTLFLTAQDRLIAIPLKH